MAWATKEQARSHWADAKSLPDPVLDVLLDVATEQCQDYAPALVVPANPEELVIPVRYMLATVYQAREVYAASSREGDVIGFGDFAIRSRPLTAAVKALLRPERGVKAVG